MTPRKVDRADLKANHKLYTEEQISDLKNIVASIESQDNTAIFVPRIKNDPDRPYSVMSMENQLYAIYRGESSKKHLGSGAFGRVKIAQNLETGQWVAMKFLNRLTAADRNEAKIHNHLGSGFTGIYERKKLSGTTLTTKHVFAMALAPGVSMETAFLDSDFQPLNISKVNRVTACKAVVEEYLELHRKGVLHIDIKIENLIYDEEPNKVTIIDFGLSEFMDENSQKVCTYRGSAFSLPPEISKLQSTNTFSQTTEVYGIGRTLADIGGFELKNKSDTKNGNSHYEAITTSADASPAMVELAELCNQMLMGDPTQRLDLTTVYNRLEKIEWLAFYEDTSTLQEAIESNSKVDIERELKNAMQVQGFDINHIIDDAGGLIHYAAMFGSDNALELLLANGADINLQNNNQETALHLASLYKADTTPDVAVVLFGTENINLDIKDNNGKTALDLATEAGNEDIKVEILAKIDERKSASTDFTESVDSVSSPIKSQHDSPAEKNEEVTPVVPVQREIKQPDRWSSTNIMNFALSNSRPDVYQSVNKLHQAIRRNDVSAVTELLKAGVDLDHKIDGKCALHLAAQSTNYNSEIVDLLIENGADVNSVDENGQTLLHLAVTWDDTELTDFLLDNSLVDVNVQDNVGETAMHLAFLYDHADIAESILQKRSEVDLSIINDEGFSAEAIGKLVLGMPDDIPKYTPAEPHPLDINLDRTSVGLPSAGLEANDPGIQNDRNRLIN